jgi:hypothetical protein
MPPRSSAALSGRTHCDLPAAVLARMLGIHIAFAWQRASTGDGTGYAADISRRAPSHQRLPQA